MANAKDVFKNRIIGYDTKPADQFQANALNYRKHPQRQRDAVNASLRELGWISTVVENRTTGNLIDGHERVWQALANNEDVPYLQVELSEDEERLALAIFDPITNMAETDAAILDELLQDVNTGESALQELLATLAGDAGLYVDNAPKGEDPGADVSKADELQAVWNVQPGDLWQLGAHRLICGDCTDEATVARVMGGEKADLGMHDPPYGVEMDKGFSGEAAFAGKGKPIPRRQYSDNWDSKPPDTFDTILAGSKSIILWGGNNFADKLPASSHWLVWDKNNTMPTFGDCELAWTNIDRKSIKKYLYEYNGLIGKEKERFHPTQKPVGLYIAVLADYSGEGDVVADYYSGSGTTIIACEQLGRKCRAVELHPPYVAVALQRYMDMTGKTPTRIT